jgi:hypothetical protein
MKPVLLEECREMFKDDTFYEKFVVWFCEQLQNDFSPVMYEHRVLGCVMSQVATKDILYERITRRILDKPSVLAVIEDRLLNDAIVE